MFLRCLTFSRKDGSQRKYLQIIQAYREGGRTRQTIVANLGRLDELIATGTLEKLTEVLSRYVEKRELLCKAEELMATSALSFGAVPIFSSLWEKLRIPEAIALATRRKRATFDSTPVIFRMVLWRLLDPQSKLSTHRWAQTISWYDGGAFELQQYYRSLGILVPEMKVMFALEYPQDDRRPPLGEDQELAAFGIICGQDPWKGVGRFLVRGAFKSERPGLGEIEVSAGREHRLLTDHDPVGFEPQAVAIRKPLCIIVGKKVERPKADEER